MCASEASGIEAVVAFFVLRLCFPRIITVEEGA